MDVASKPPASQFPKRKKTECRSLTVSMMEKVGVPIKTASFKSYDISLQHFQIDTLSWDVPMVCKFLIEEKEFATGGFRAVYRAQSSDTFLAGKSLVVKNFSHLPRKVH